MTTRIARSRPRSRRDLNPADNGKPVGLPNGLIECSPTEDEIRVAAYYKWIGAGCPPGDGIAFWLEAEHQLGDHRAKAS